MSRTFTKLFAAAALALPFDQVAEYQKVEALSIRKRLDITSLRDRGSIAYWYTKDKVGNLMMSPWRLMDRVCDWNQSMQSSAEEKKDQERVKFLTKLQHSAKDKELTLSHQAVPPPRIDKENSTPRPQIKQRKLILMHGKKVPQMLGVGPPIGVEPPSRALLRQRQLTELVDPEKNRMELIEKKNKFTRYQQQANDLINIMLQDKNKKLQYGEIGSTIKYWSHDELELEWRRYQSILAELKSALE